MNDPAIFVLFNEIGIIDQLGGTRFEQVLPKGVTRAQFTVLNHFVRLGHHERSPAQLADAFQVRRPTITNTLARMGRHGLVAIRPDPADGRAKLVSLTDHGHRVREEAVAAIAPLAGELSEILTDAEVATMLPLLRRLRMALDAARD